jgi:type II secretory pathway component PulC
LTFPALEAAVGGLRRRRTDRLTAVATASLRRGPLLLGLLLCGLAVWATRGLWRVVTAPSALVQTPVATPALPRPTLTVDVAAIAGRHLFGEAASKRSQAPPPPTRAALVLGGVWYTPAGNAYALIGAPGAAQKPYRTGDRLPGGAELVGVEAGRVLLRRDSQVETLALPRAALQSGPAGSAPRRR